MHIFTDTPNVVQSSFELLMEPEESGRAHLLSDKSCWSVRGASCKISLIESLFFLSLLLQELSSMRRVRM